MGRSDLKDFLLTWNVPWNHLEPRASSQSCEKGLLSIVGHNICMIDSPSTFAAKLKLWEAKVLKKEEAFHPWKKGAKDKQRNAPLSTE